MNANNKSGNIDENKQAGNRPNIVLVTADSVRADHCSFLNSEMDTTPALNELASEGLVYENAISPGPRTPSSMPVIWTGMHVGKENKGVYNDRDEKQSNWRERRDRIQRHLQRFETIPERLSRLGYDTGGLTTNPWTDIDTAFNKGFDHFKQVERIPTDGQSTYVRRLIKRASKLPKLPDARRWLLTWSDVYHRILETRQKLTEPYFLWVFLLDSHQPYFAPRKYREETTWIEMYYANSRYKYSFSSLGDLPARFEERLHAAYRDSIRSVDGCVSRLLDDLEDDDPAFVFHSDHGEAQFEHGTRGHRPELYEENIRVPLLAHNVGNAGRISEQASLRHLPEFLVSVARNDVSSAEFLKSPSLTKTEESERIALRTNEWKRIKSSSTWNFAKDTPRDELYDLVSDPGERNNVYQEYDEIVELCDVRLSDHDLALEERQAIFSAVQDCYRPRTGTL